MMRVFLCGGFHSGWQGTVKYVVSHQPTSFSGLNPCLDVGPQPVFFIDPRDHGLDAEELYTPWNLYWVRQCEIVFVYIEKTNPACQNMALEVGYAKALGKFIIVVDEKDNGDPVKRYMGMTRQCADVLFDNLEEGIAYLRVLTRID